MNFDGCSNIEDSEVSIATEHLSQNEGIKTIIISANHLKKGDNLNLIIVWRGEGDWVFTKYALK